jgi:hypothetical protein
MRKTGKYYYERQVDIMKKLMICLLVGVLMLCPLVAMASPGSD